LLKVIIRNMLFCNTDNGCRTELLAVPHEITPYCK